MKTLRAELLRHGLTLESFKDIWNQARKGDLQARTLVFQITSKSEFGRQLVDTWADERVRRMAKSQTERDARKAHPTQKPKTLSLWQKSQRTIGKSGARVIAGGLPSLGKRSR